MKQFSRQLELSAVLTVMAVLAAGAIAKLGVAPHLLQLAY
jgi:hypothetical protein